MKGDRLLGNKGDPPGGGGRHADDGGSDIINTYQEAIDTRISNMSCFVSALSSTPQPLSLLRVVSLSLKQRAHDFDSKSKRVHQFTPLVHLALASSSSSSLHVTFYMFLLVLLVGDVLSPFYTCSYNIFTKQVTPLYPPFNHVLELQKCYLAFFFF